MKPLTIILGMMMGGGCVGLAAYLHNNDKAGWLVFALIGLAHGIGSFICHVDDDVSSKKAKQVDGSALGRKRIKCRPVNRNKSGKSKNRIGF